MAQAHIGIIGGSGLYKMDALKDVEEVGGVVVMERKITLAPEALLRLNSALTF